jgi:hypothetical protein
MRPRRIGEFGVKPRSMRKRRLLILAGGAIVAAGISGLGMWTVFPDPSSTPMSAVYVGRRNFRNGETLQTSPTFWFTNHTSKALAVSIWSVEVRDGTNWTKQDYRSPHAAPVMLAPSAGAYVNVDFSSQQEPSNSWRLELRSAEKLSRLESAFKAIRYAPRGWRHIHGTAMPARKLLDQMKGNWYGNAKPVLSEEVEEQQESKRLP